MMLNAIILHVFLILTSIARCSAQPKCSAAPQPASASAGNNAPLPGRTYFYQRLVNGVYWLTQDGYNIMFVVTTTGVVITDAPPGLTNSTIAAVREVTQLPITHMVYTHSHIDHIGESFRFGNIIRIGHIETARALAQYNDTNRPVPNISFNDNLTMTIGGTVFQFDYHGVIHAAGNIFIWLPNERVLNAADMVSPGTVPFFRLGLAPDVFTTLHSMDRILEYPFQYFISGHGARLTTRQDVQTIKEYYRDVQTNAITAANTVQFNTIAARVADPSNSALAGTEYQKAMIDACSRLTVPKWINRLAFADVWTPAACDVVIWAQSLDYGQRVV